ncbi:MAG: signal recognition particle-docking protein FtsY [Anaerolineaceae bacterium]
MADIFTRWKESLDRTRKATFGRLASVFGTNEITNDTWDELEETLIQADVGVDTTLSVTGKLRDMVKKEGIVASAELMEKLRAELFARLDKTSAMDLEKFKPAVVLLVGVNGSGKTTTAAKLGKLWQNQGKKVLLVAADTFRAAATDQLQVWGERLKIPVIASTPDADPGAVAYDGIQAAIARDMDIVLIDTAGRLHTRYNLMEEIKKVHRVSGKALPGAPHATLLVLDATTGQNALLQARAFKEAFPIDGIILAKLDSSARGGMVFAIQHELGIPVYYAGLGEKPEDIQVFDPEAFVEGIFTLSS